MTTDRILVTDVMFHVEPEKWSVSGRFTDGRHGWIVADTWVPWIAALCQRAKETQRMIDLTWDDGKIPHFRNILKAEIVSQPEAA